LTEILHWLTILHNNHFRLEVDCAHLSFGHPHQKNKHISIALSPSPSKLRGLSKSFITCILQIQYYIHFKK
jgi:hypothetical protein